MAEIMTVAIEVTEEDRRAYDKHCEDARAHNWEPGTIRDWIITHAKSGMQNDQELYDVRTPGPGMSRIRDTP